MTTKARKTSRSTDGDFAEVLYNEGEVQSYAGRIEEMSIDEVCRLLRDSGMDHLIDNCVDDAERPYTRSRTEFNLILPERDFSSLLERLSAVEHAITNGDRGQESTRDPSTPRLLVKSSNGTLRTE